MLYSITPAPFLLEHKVAEQTGDSSTEPPNLRPVDPKDIPWAELVVLTQLRRCVKTAGLRPRRRIQPLVLRVFHFCDGTGYAISVPGAGFYLWGCEHEFQPWVKEGLSQKAEKCLKCDHVRLAEDSSD